MKEIQKLLQRYYHIKAPEKTIRTIVRDTVKKHTGFELLDHEFQVQKSTIHLRCHSVVREEILQHKTAILADVERETGEHFSAIF